MITLKDLYERVPAERDPRTVFYALCGCRYEWSDEKDIYWGSLIGSGWYIGGEVCRDYWYKKHTFDIPRERVSAGYCMAAQGVGRK